LSYGAAIVLDTYVSICKGNFIITIITIIVVVVIIIISSSRRTALS
jgi:hypothetical protein